MKKKSFAFLSLMLAALLALSVSLSASASDGTLPNAEINGIVDTTTDPALITSPFTAAVSAVRGSIVMVNNYQMVTSGGSNYYNYGFPFGFGYGNPYGGNGYSAPTQREQLAGTGSGTVISAYGHILTNFHVVEDASRVTVWDGENELEASVVTYSEEQDLAVLLCPEIKLPAVMLGDSDKLQVGEWAIVIGNPLGEDFFRSVTVGIVSALERSVESEATDKYGRRTTVENSMIQVDAAINSGNSGGAMFNTLGQLMGIPSLKYSSNFLSSTTIDNIGMCIPINVAKPLIREALEAYNADDVAEYLSEKEKESQRNTIAQDTNQPRMGVSIKTLDSTNNAVSQGILPRGAYVTEVEAGSPAEKAGIQVGDIIVEVDGVIVSTSDEMAAEVKNGQRKEGDVITIKLYRAENILSAQFINEIGDGEYIDVEVTLEVIAEPAA